MIVNHAGMAVDIDPPGRALWREGMRALAASPQVSVKISGVGFVHCRWTAELIRDYVLETIDIFGADRAMFASDFPTDKLFGRNADRIYRLGAWGV